jgi:cellulose synthase/poly-beta-1,6-N-acetylglucosamine synthase-like glycosyltransferase
MVFFFRVFISELFPSLYFFCLVCFYILMMGYDFALNCSVVAGIIDGELQGIWQWSST